MSNQSLALLLVLSVLIGCANPDKPNLALACSLTKCTCFSDGGGYFERNFTTHRSLTTEVLWTERGEAYCPQGFSLRAVDENKKKQYYTPPVKPANSRLPGRRRPVASPPAQGLVSLAQ